MKITLGPLEGLALKEEFRENESNFWLTDHIY